jgi:hypothetical protein
MVILGIKECIDKIIEQAKREEWERIAMMLAVEVTEFCPPESNCVVCDSDCVECIKQWLEPEPAEGAES